MCGYANAQGGKIYIGCDDNGNIIGLPNAHKLLEDIPNKIRDAMLLFSKDPEKWQLGAFVKIGFFETDADLLYQDEVHGSILEQIDKIVELVYLKYMKAKITYEGMQRIERYFVPEDALPVKMTVYRRLFTQSIPMTL
ncbi:MAG: hypothetical protein HFI00_18615 [Lachnospiraceae bacterium]|nr:hypothetical protein [Lachnospiraceae bacterium]